MQIPVEVDPSSRQSLQVQLFDQFRDLILSGHLKPGTRLPATRDLSGQLSVSRNTVLLTYDQLIAEGYLQSRAAVGTFVSPSLPEDTLFSERPQLPGTGSAQRLPDKCEPAFSGRAQAVVNPNRGRLAYDFWVGRPDAKLFPHKIWRRMLLRSFDRPGANLTEYRCPGGLFELRQAIADRLGPSRGINVNPEQVIVVGGSQEGLNLVARLLLRPGQRVAIENPCYQGAVFVFESYGAELVPIRVDTNGLDFSELSGESVDLVYTTPSHQYPLGETLSLDRRMRFLDWGWRTGTYILEDDYDSDFRYNAAPVTALKGLDRHGCTIYLGTFSKSLGAGLRLGYLALPRELAGPAQTLKALLDNGNPWLEQAALAEFISSGSFDTHLRRIRQAYLDRRDALIHALRRHFGEVDLRGIEGGMHLVWHLPPDFPNAVQVEQIARQHGVGIYAFESGGAYAFPGAEGADRVLMIGYSSLTEHQIEEGIGELAKALAAPGAGRS
jgi:GntR family transcriptional regulator/MocR family aminotransferase